MQFRRLNMVSFNDNYKPKPVSTFEIREEEMRMLHMCVSFVIIAKVGMAEPDDRENVIEAMEPYVELREKLKSKLNEAGVQIEDL